MYLDIKVSVECAGGGALSRGMGMRRGHDLPFFRPVGAPWPTINAPFSAPIFNLRKNLYFQPSFCPYFW